MSDEQLIEMYGMVREVHAIVKNGLMHRLDTLEASHAARLESCPAAGAVAAHENVHHTAPETRKATARDKLRTGLMIGSLVGMFLFGAIGWLK